MKNSLTLTPEQKRAVEDRSGNLLVSAAAGSGKTSVLAQRIVALVEEGADVRRMLVSTFTNLAAAEMRERIARELQNRGEELGDRRLLSQAEYVELADICTIHKFGIKLIRENFLALGVSANLRVAGEEEVEALKGQAMDATFRALYREENPEFIGLRRRYARRTDDALKYLVSKLTGFCASKPEGLDWLGSAHSTRAWAEEAKKTYDAWILEKIRAAQELMDLSCDLSQSQGWQNQLAKDWVDKETVDALRTAFEESGAEGLLSRLENAQIGRIQPKLGPPEAKERLQYLKKRARGLLKELMAAASPATRQALEEDLAYQKEQAKAFYLVAKRYQEEYAERKQEHGVMDYDDIIRYAYTLLQNPEIQRCYQAQYDYIFIDEYQDTNPIQDALLLAVSRGDNCFMVGDMKQSIYRFRLADPLIFKRRAQEFSKSTGAQVIHMNRNFRSGSMVIDTVNSLMGALMDEDLGELSYTGGERLEAGSTLAGSAELLLTQEDQESERPEPAVRREARQVAARILALREEPLEGTDRPIAFGDICLLLRKTRGNAQVFRQVLEEYGIPVSTEELNEGDGPEVETFVNLLRVMVSWPSDTAFLSVLRSHIGDFDEAEMADIRISLEEGSFRAAFLEKSKEQDALGQKCAAFLEKIEGFRLLERGLPLGELLVRLKIETQWEAFWRVQPGGEERAGNFTAFLEKLQEIAENRESLYDLVSHLEELKKLRGTYMGLPAAKGRKDAVRMMSIHKSKGLEFPVVILAGLSQKFNQMDTREALLLHDGLGIALDKVDPIARRRQVPFLKTLFKYTMSREMRSEELRVLYVAMTRAKQKLIFSATVKSLETLEDRVAWPLGRTEIKEGDNYFFWILAALSHGACIGGKAGVEAIIERVSPSVSLPVSEPVSVDLSGILEEAKGQNAPDFLNYRGCRLPVKLGVSTLLPQFIDDMEAPKISGKPALSGAALGTLIHLFLQNVDFKARTREKVEAELARMEKMQLFSQEEIAAIRPLLGQLTLFLRGDMGARIRNAKRVLREAPFSLAVEASRIFTEDPLAKEETIIVQGILDLAFLEKDGWVLLDYKSNWVEPDNLQKLAQRYRLQMELYEQAVIAITDQPVKEKYLYFLRKNLFLQIF